jgi:coatomer subunit beta
VPAPSVKVRPQVLADGTYATQSAVAVAAPSAASAAADPHSAQNLRIIFLAGDTFFGAVVAVSLVKLLLRLKAAAAATGSPAASELRKRSAQIMLLLVSMLRHDEQKAGQSELSLDRDSRDRIATCLKMITEPSKDIVHLWLEAYRASYAATLEERRSRDIEEQDARNAANACQPDDLIDFAHLKHRKGVAQIELEDEVATDLQLATGLAPGVDASTGGMRRTMQLTGLSDAVYAEAEVVTHQYDVVLDVTVINRTKATMQNLCLELATMGDLKLVERPQNYTLAAGESKRLRANIKVCVCVGTYTTNFVHFVATCLC